MVNAGSEGVSTLQRWPVLDVGVDAVTLFQAVRQIVAWARHRASRYVCAANVHMVMEAHDDPTFRQIVRQADLVVPDGMPLVWLLRVLGVKGQERVYGPDLMAALCVAAEEKGLPVGLYGSTPITLARLQRNLHARWPNLQIVYVHSPPFRELSPDEEAAVRQDIRAAGVALLFVALGCPKQERWMARQRAAGLPAVMVGVGAAFDFLAGVKPQAPLWLQRWGLEWLFRLLSEPRRLARRYLYHNPRFVVLAARQILFRRLPQD